MIRSTLGLLRACAALVLIAWAPAVSGQGSNHPPKTADAAEKFQTSVLPVLARDCFGCHNQKLNTAGLNLEAFRDGSAALREKAVWTKVLAKLNAGEMPPRGMAAPTKAELATVTGWIQVLVGPANLVSLPAGAPGRVTARRLNRAEYNNTIHDLLGVSVKPADEFPVDDSGYGFDNIGDVLTISPLLMEKYISAARRLSHLAVYAETLPPKPTVLAVFMPKKGPDEAVGLASGITLPYSLRGSLYTRYVFPVDAEYEIRVRIRNHRDINGIKYDAPKDEFLESFEAVMHAHPGQQEGPPPEGAIAPKHAGPGGAAGRGGRGPRRPLTPEELKAREEKDRLEFPPLQLLVTLDGKKIAEDFIEGNTNYMYDRGDVIGRVFVTAGEHYLRASFPEMANLDDPRRNINPDGRRRIYVEQAEVAGPYNPKPGPPDSHKKIFVCEEHTPACARKIVETLGQRAYRRSMTQREMDQIAGLVAMARRQGDSFEEGVRLAVEAILISPNFLFRIETDPKPNDGGAPGPHPINDYELASRLSYFLWSTMPDDELFRLSKEKTLSKPEVLQAQVKRMLVDRKAGALVDNFAGQWLGIRNLDRKSPDPNRFPATDDELLDYMHTETNMFVAALFREDHTILDFIDAPFTFLNGPLASHYGIAGVKGEEFRRVELTGSQRSGVLTQGSILIVSSYPTRTSVVTRGKWVLENLLGSGPPPPPPGVPPLAEGEIGSSASLRQKMEQHRANPACAACHVQMDPIGFGLENYDAAGAWRTHDGKFPIDASGTLPGGVSFAGAQGLKQVLRSKADLFTRNFTEQLMTYSLGRGLESFDKSTVDSIVADVTAHDCRFSRLVTDIINSKAFRMRSAEKSETAIADRGRQKNDPSEKKAE